MNHRLQRELERNVREALAEDIGQGDLTAALVPADQNDSAHLICREQAVLCGIPWFEACFHALDREIKIEWQAAEGGLLRANQEVCHLRGNKRALLSGERSAMNFLQLLSGVATTTRHYVDAVRGYGAKIVDTRKTLPGLRHAQKYAVSIGGGVNHRLGLDDGVLIKENHIIAAGGLRQILQQLHDHTPRDVLLQVEVETLEQLEVALAAAVPFILLDNMSHHMMREAVRRTAGRAQLEASGGVRLDNIRDIAATGVDRISIGALTKDVRATDYSMRFTEAR